MFGRGVLLIDERSIGFSPKLVQDVFVLLRGVTDAGTTGRAIATSQGLR